VGRAPAGLGDELQARQAFEQLGGDGGALADQHQRIGVLKTRRQRVEVRDRIVVDRHLVTGELRETVQPADRVLVVVRDDDSHPGATFAPTSQTYSGCANAPSRTSCFSRSMSVVMMRSRSMSEDLEMSTWASTG
jgi:hypothetical protein